jgi:hypothetical protein
VTATVAAVGASRSAAQHAPVFFVVRDRAWALPGADGEGLSGFGKSLHALCGEIEALYQTLRHMDGRDDPSEKAEEIDW